MSNVNNYIKIILPFGNIGFIHFFHDDFADGALLLAMRAQAETGGRIVVYRTPDRTPFWDSVGTVLVCDEHKYINDKGHLLCKRCNTYPKENVPDAKKRRVIESAS